MSFNPKQPSNPTQAASSTPARKAQADAVWAFDTVKEWLRKLNQKQQKEIISHIKKLPAHLQTSGLAQTLLFYGKKNSAIAQALADKVCGTNDVAAAVRKLADGGMGQYRIKARQAMRLAQWLKRMAEVEDKEESTASTEPN